MTTWIQWTWCKGSEVTTCSERRRLFVEDGVLETSVDLKAHKLSLEVIYLLKKKVEGVAVDVEIVGHGIQHCGLC